MMRNNGRAARGAAALGLSCIFLLQSGPLASANVPAADLGALEVRFEGLRSAKGYLRGCLTRNPSYYPKCEKDPAALKLSVAAGKDAHLAFGGVPPGDYAVLILHDENGNNKVDTMLGIPREGVGFSRNPRIMFGPPRFDAVRIHVPAGPSATGVKLQYFL
jgi:uncharacterized protein (DUF2141 family)